MKQQRDEKHESFEPVRNSGGRAGGWTALDFQNPNGRLTLLSPRAFRLLQLSVSENSKRKWTNALDCEAEFALQTFKVLVRRQVEEIEARMAAWETARVCALLDRKPARAIASLEILGAIDRHARRAGCKLEQTRLALRWP